MAQPEMAAANALLDGPAAARFLLACNRKEADEHWASDAEEWVGKASMAERHRFLLLKDLHWGWFNCLAFGIRGGAALADAVATLEAMKEAALSYTRADGGWSTSVGLYLHCYPLNSVQALHLHIVDLAAVGPTHAALAHKNLPIDAVLEVLRAEAAAAGVVVMTAAEAAAAAKAAKAAAAAAAGFVDKAAYGAWEAEVVRRFFVGGRPHTALVPADGAPAVLSKEKYIVVVVAGGAADQVAAGTPAGLPSHQHVQLWHIGKQKADGVRFGYAADDGVFKHPACDVGGLTNLKQKLGEAASFVGAATAWEGAAAGDARRDEVARALAAEWARLSRKTLPPTLAADLAKFLGTVGAAMGAHAVTLRFHALPPEHRTVVTSADVAAATGKYYVRIFGGDHHAKLSDGAGLFCGVTDKFVTPNLNEANLLSEYVTYAEKEAEAAEAAAAEKAAAEAAAAAAAAAEASKATATKAVHHHHLAAARGAAAARRRQPRGGAAARLLRLAVQGARDRERHDRRTRREGGADADEGGGAAAGTGVAARGGVRAAAAAAGGRAVGGGEGVVCVRGDGARGHVRRSRQVPYRRDLREAAGVVRRAVARAAHQRHRRVLRAVRDLHPRRVRAGAARRVQGLPDHRRAGAGVRDALRLRAVRRLHRVEAAPPPRLQRRRAPRVWRPPSTRP